MKKLLLLSLFIVSCGESSSSFRAAEERCEQHYYTLAEAINGMCYRTTSSAKHYLTCLNVQLKSLVENDPVCDYVTVAP
jgi:hypothetical protein